MVLDPHRWLELRRFRPLYESGAMSLREIAKETGLNRRTVSKYLKDPASLAPPKREVADQRPRRVVDEVAPLIDAMLRSEILLKGRVIHERLVQEYGVAINYQRVKLYLQEARPRIAEELGISPGELAGLHRRFEVVPGAQAQVDWGDEGKILAHVGIPKVYSFHMTLSYSRDPFCCFTTSQDLATFFDCHRKAFAHFGGVPMSVVYDRTKTVVRRHVAPGEAVPLHPEAVAFAGHYDFDIDVLAAYRPQAASTSATSTGPASHMPSVGNPVSRERMATVSTPAPPVVRTRETGLRFCGTQFETASRFNHDCTLSISPQRLYCERALTVRAPARTRCRRAAEEHDNASPSHACTARHRAQSPGRPHHRTAHHRRPGGERAGRPGRRTGPGSGVVRPRATGPHPADGLQQLELHALQGRVQRVDGQGHRRPLRRARSQGRRLRVRQP